MRGGVRRRARAGGRGGVRVRGGDGNVEWIGAVVRSMSHGPLFGQRWELRSMQRVGMRGGDVPRSVRGKLGRRV